MKKTSEDGLVVFDPGTHTYIKGEQILTGVTSYISRYKNKFDSDHWSKVIAKREHTTQDLILKQWKDKADASILQGHCVHSVFENFFNTGIIDHTGILAKEYVAEQFINDFFMSGRLTPVDCECIVYNDTLASQIDMVVRNRQGEHFVIDWKTNGEIKRNYYHYMLPPFEAVPDCDYYHYSIQVKIYEHLYTKYPIKTSYIVHIKNDGYEFITPADIRLPNIF